MSALLVLVVIDGETHTRTSTERTMRPFISWQPLLLVRCCVVIDYIWRKDAYRLRNKLAIFNFRYFISCLFLLKLPSFLFRDSSSFSFQFTQKKKLVRRVVLLEGKKNNQMSKAFNFFERLYLLKLAESFELTNQIIFVEKTVCGEKSANKCGNHHHHDHHYLLIELKCKIGRQ